MNERSVRAVPSEQGPRGWFFWPVGASFALVSALSLPLRRCLWEVTACTTRRGTLSPLQLEPRHDLSIKLWIMRVHIYVTQVNQMLCHTSHNGAGIIKQLHARLFFWLRAQSIWMYVVCNFQPNYSEFTEWSNLINRKSHFFQSLLILIYWAWTKYHFWIMLIYHIMKI